MTPAGSFPWDCMSPHDALCLLMKQVDFSNSKILPLNHLCVLLIRLSAMLKKKKKLSLLDNLATIIKNKCYIA